MLPDTGIDDVKKQRNAEYAKHINDPVLSSLKMEGISLLFFISLAYFYYINLYFYFTNKKYLNILKRFPVFSVVAKTSAKFVYFISLREHLSSELPSSQLILSLYDVTKPFQLTGRSEIFNDTVLKKYNYLRE
jgi:hypothetical protein